MDEQKVIRRGVFYWFVIPSFVAGLWWLSIANYGLRDLIFGDFSFELLWTIVRQLAWLFIFFFSLCLPCYYSDWHLLRYIKAWRRRPIIFATVRFALITLMTFLIWAGIVAIFQLFSVTSDGGAGQGLAAAGVAFLAAVLYPITLMLYVLQARWFVKRVRIPVGNTIQPTVSGIKTG